MTTPHDLPSDHEERRVWPPRLISVFDGLVWLPEQLHAWRRGNGSSRCLVSPAGAHDPAKSPARWVDARLVRPRGSEAINPPTSGPALSEAPLAVHSTRRV